MDRMGFDEFDAEEEEVRPDFPCPYCCEDHDIASLCAHLEEEHPFESKVAVSVETLEIVTFFFVAVSVMIIFASFSKIKISL